MTQRDSQHDIVMPTTGYRGGSPPFSLPPTDPKNATLAEIWDAIERYTKGRDVPVEHLLPYRIDEHQYQELERQLSEDDFCRAKLRRDYFPREHLFILRLRMPSRIHAHFISKVNQEISRQLRGVEGSSSKFVQEIEFEASTEVIPSDPAYGRNDPDGSFRHNGEPFPGLITEIAYSRQGKRFKALAHSYILGSDLRVRAMISFDIPYKTNKNKAATVSVWRPKALQDDEGEAWTVTSEVVVFRNDNGRPNLDPKAGLRAHLTEFASANFCQSLDLKETVFISCDTLCALLEDAESTDDVQRHMAASQPRPVLRKRAMSDTSEE
ncbi:hypothetical protein PV08_06091 [Exophiala spinifera]|uniref:Uncharacterized protein n=1 Tax=Exophiala spinifera TaxID=91928 RepID=A0A0D2BBS1_9EURO|nr:uncharacterized protein PV08_06091 [Exophiala spinifera]KIW16040.1 hypothetical protein PV08_06091 [Exophiala spinifera]